MGQTLHFFYRPKFQKLMWKKNCFQIYPRLHEASGEKIFDDSEKCWYWKVQKVSQKNIWGVKIRNIVNN